MKFIYCMLMMFLGSGFITNAEGIKKVEENMKINFRVIPQEGYFFLSCAVNISDKTILLHQVINPFMDSNTMSYTPLSFAFAGSRGTGVSNSFAPGHFPPALRIDPSEMYNLYIGDEYFNMFRLVRGHYVKNRWFFGGFHSNYLYVGFPNDEGVIASPVVDLPLGHQTVKDQIALAFLFHENKPRELGFLVMDKLAEPFIAVEPLSEKSSILVTSPAIDYHREIYVKDKDIVEHELSSGEVAEWRIAWSKVLELIPEEDRQKIIEAGGDLDLVWRTGGEESPPLLMNIAPPETFKDSVLIPHPEKENVMIIADPQGE